VADINVTASGLQPYIPPMNSTAPVVGILLAGGKSSRMGGGDKCLRPLGGKPILAHIMARLRPQVADMIINANEDAQRFAAFGLPVVADSVSGHAGPLAGIQTGLAWIRANRPDSEYGVTVAADTPFFPEDMVQRFIAERGNRPALLVARSAQGVHPVIGLWPVVLADELEDSLKQGARTARAWTEQHKAIEVDFPPVEIGGRKIDPFFNINWPEDLAEAEALITEPAP
jgi:molybdopterin-guanine dinucleotide biosynthesis protein A